MTPVRYVLTCRCLLQASVQQSGSRHTRSRGPRRCRVVQASAFQGQLESLTQPIGRQGKEDVHRLRGRRWRRSRLWHGRWQRLRTGSSAGRRNWRSSHRGRTGCTSAKGDKEHSKGQLHSCWLPGFVDTLSSGVATDLRIQPTSPLCCGCGALVNSPLSSLAPGRPPISTLIAIDYRRPYPITERRAFVTVLPPCPACPASRSC